MPFRTAIRSILPGLFCLLASLAHAQETPQSPWRFTLEGGAAHQSEADFKDSEGGFEADRWFVSAGVDYGWSPRNSIGLYVGGGETNFTFSDDSGFGGGQPWNHVRDFRISATARFRISPRGTGFIVPTLRFNGEPGADSGDSRTWGLFAAAAWQVRPNLNIGPGIGVFDRLSGSTRVFPILAIDWDINERWNLGTGRGLAASQGPGLTLGYKASERWTVALSGRYEDLEFRLDDEGVAPNGIGRDQTFPLALSGRFEANENVNLALLFGVELGGKLKLKDAFGELIDESKYKPALLFGATFDFRF